MTDHRAEYEDDKEQGATAEEQVWEAMGYSVSTMSRLLPGHPSIEKLSGVVALVAYHQAACDRTDEVIAGLEADMTEAAGWLRLCKQQLQELQRENVELKRIAKEAKDYEKHPAYQELKQSFHDVVREGQSLRQKVSDAEWLRDVEASAVNMNFADPGEPVDWRWQIYDFREDLIGDAMVKDYWQALHAAREAAGE